MVWKKFLPLCLPESDDAWVENTLLKCNSWPEAKIAFRKHNESVAAASRYTRRVYTMTMSPNESIMEYSK